MGQRKITVTNIDGSVLEMPITEEEAQGILAKVSGGTGIVSTRHRSTKRKTKSSHADDGFPTDEQLREFLSDGDKTVNELAEHFLKRKLNAHKDTRLWHRLYGAKRRVQGDMKSQ